jgi:DNA-directed RNA polymerase subunit RPC12/RpoP
VPDKDQPEASCEPYPLSDASNAASDGASPKAYLSVVCAICHTRMYAEDGQLGQSMTCPNCGTVCAVERSAEPPPAAEASLAPKTSTGEYDICTTGGQPSPDDKIVYGKHIRLTCSRCQTRLLATADQVGQFLVCPDCQTRNRVPEMPPETPQGDPLTELTYDVRPPVESPPVVALPVKTGANDRVAGRRGESSGGLPKNRSGNARQESLRSKDSETARGSRGGRSSRFSIADSADRDRGPEESSSHKSRQRQRSTPQTASERRAYDQAIIAGKGKKEEWSNERPLLPVHPFLTGVWLFPLTRGVRVLWFAVAIWVAGEIGLAAFASSQIAVESAGSQFLGAMAIAGSMVLFVFGMMMGSAYFMTVLRDSAEGNDEIANWPELVWLEWLFHCLYFFVAFVVAGAIGKLAAGWLASAGWPLALSNLAGWGVATILYPIAILSALEVGLPFVPLSIPILRSVFSAWRAWLAFWFITFLFVPTTAVVLMAVVDWLPALGIVPVAIIGPWAAILYCRLLGRLAWCCMEKARELDAIEEEADQTEDDGEPA